MNRIDVLKKRLNQLMLSLEFEHNEQKITDLQSDIIVVQRELNQLRNHG